MDAEYLQNPRDITAEMAAQYQRAAEEQYRLAYQQYFDALAAEMDQAPSPERPQVPSADIEDEETRQQPDSDGTGGPSAEVLTSVFESPDVTQPQTGQVSAECNSQAKTSSKANVYFEQYPFFSSSSFYPHKKQVYTDPKSQAGSSSENTTDRRFEPYPFPSTSSFDPYAERCSHPASRSTPKTAKSGVTGGSGEHDQPTDLSVPKRSPDVANDTKPVSNVSNSGSASDRETGGSPTRQPTYNHFSDVSNDSADDVAGESRTSSQPDSGIGICFSYYQFLRILPYILLHPTFPHCFTIYLMNRLGDCLEKVLRRYVEQETIGKIGADFCIECSIILSNVTEDDINKARNAEKAEAEAKAKAKEHEIASDNCKNIVITEVPEERPSESGQQASEEHLRQPDPTTQPRVEQPQPRQSRAVFSEPEKPPPLVADYRTPDVRLSPPPAQEPTSLDEVDMQSAAESDASNVEPAPEWRLVPYLPRHIQNCTAYGKRPETAAPTGQPAASEVPTEVSSQDHPMEPLFLVELEDPPDSESPPVAGSAAASPSGRDEAEEDGERRRREPWYNSSLSSFVARYAFSVPRYVWTHRREGEPRRSKRIATKKRVKVYYLRQKRRKN